MANYDIKIEGLNFDRLIREFNRLNIKLFNLNKPNCKVMEFSLKTSDYLKFKKLPLIKNYVVSITKTRGIAKLVSDIYKHIALTICGAICVVLFLFFSNFTLKIDVLGLQTISKQEIILLLNNFGVKTNQINSKSNLEIEKYLKQNNDKISLVSVIKKGTNLIVNIKEKIDTSISLTPITAPYNMQITKLNIKQGSSKFKVGDMVKKGEIIVSPAVILSNGEITQLTPIANVEGEVWIGGEVRFETEKKVSKKTGKKQIFSYYEWGNNKLFYKTPTVKFEKFDKVVYNNYVFKNWFVPLKYTRITFYELTEETITQNFEDAKAELVLKSRNIAYSNLPEGKSVIEENTQVNQVGNTIFINTYLKINLVLWG